MLAIHRQAPGVMNATILFANKKGKGKSNEK
jgi:hypothetical protein